MLHRARRCLLLLLPLIMASGSSAAPAQEELEQARAAAGINQITAPSIEALLKQLRALEPIPFEKVWRKPPEHPPQERVRIALLTGRLIADGFLVVAAERPERIEPVGRSLLRLTKALGFGDKIAARGRQVIEAAKKERWAQARQELIHTQADAEAALVSLRDDDLVNLVALGGWLRGLEITTAAVAEKFTPERSGQLWQLSQADYFLERLKAFRPSTKRTPVVQHLTRVLDDVAAAAAKPQPLEADVVQNLTDLAREANDALGAP
jgi:hypothetical protein